MQIKVHCFVHSRFSRRCAWFISTAANGVLLILTRLNSIGGAAQSERQTKNGFAVH
jgi:hypothetical protein